ncbi:DUF692 domain-containing protein [Paremcibacter congregatus]|uniref:UPF0276 protein CRD36_15390 n=1 Tax=Paremcibacter congregatus TaxID=2043170 RepID=A0A2G4YN60_9PROT|nr:DUF692 domain-containing protein [Paremcibacter congregatus]PHZ83748.1 hypothetical protein CRD36_15390 [Paremcibacter congregatus]QDE27449.1 DUF692 domain-containing protein [Paremcibacter congregatus]
MTQSPRPYLGFGLGLRPDHYESVLTENPSVDWFEIISENYMVPGGKPLYYLDQIIERYPVVMHGVSLSIGATDPLNMEYLADLKKLADRVNPSWVSDHMCWTGLGGHNLHDLMPLPYNQDTARHVIDRVKQVQDYLGRQILLENASSYLGFTNSDMTEWEFIAEVAEGADCLLLLDINNIYVSGFNHDFDPLAYMQAIPKDRVWQFHLAGHEDNGDVLIDTHDHPVRSEVWDLYAKACEIFGPVSTMIERDDNIPALPVLLAELDQAREIGEKAWGITDTERRDRNVRP